MKGALQTIVPQELLSELERSFFWWEPVGAEPRSQTRILAQAMDQALFADVRRLETVVGAETLVHIMLNAEPGWFSDRSWEFWRGRLTRATGQPIPHEPPRRTFGD